MSDGHITCVVAVVVTLVLSAASLDTDCWSQASPRCTEDDRPQPRCAGGQLSFWLAPADLTRASDWPALRFLIGLFGQCHSTWHATFKIASVRILKYPGNARVRKIGNCTFSALFRSGHHRWWYSNLCKEARKVRILTYISECGCSVIPSHSSSSL